MEVTVLDLGSLEEGTITDGELSTQIRNLSSRIPAETVPEPKLALVK